jgi:hypothetical protein
VYIKCIMAAYSSQYPITYLSLPHPGNARKQNVHWTHRRHISVHNKLYAPQIHSTSRVHAVPRLTSLLFLFLPLFSFLLCSLFHSFSYRLVQVFLILFSVLFSFLVFPYLFSFLLCSLFIFPSLLVSLLSPSLLVSLFSSPPLLSSRLFSSLLFSSLLVPFPSFVFPLLFLFSFLSLSRPVSFLSSLLWPSLLFSSKRKLILCS